MASTLRTFVLVRLEDATGVSGVGVVAEGVRWTDGSVTLRWRSRTPSTIHYEGGISDVEEVHGHAGRTSVRWTNGGCA